MCAQWRARTSPKRASVRPEEVSTEESFTYKKCYVESASKGVLLTHLGSQGHLRTAFGSDGCAILKSPNE